MTIYNDYVGLSLPANIESRLLYMPHCLLESGMKSYVRFVCVNVRLPDPVSDMFLTLYTCPITWHESEHVIAQFWLAVAVHESPAAAVLSVKGNWIM